MITLNFLLCFHCWFCYAGTSAGVGFAIPSSTVLKIALQLIQFSKVSCLLVDSSFSFFFFRLKRDTSFKIKKSWKFGF